MHTTQRFISIGILAALILVAAPAASALGISAGAGADADVSVQTGVAGAEAQTEARLGAAVQVRDCGTLPEDSRHHRICLRILERLEHSGERREESRRRHEKRQQEKQERREEMKEEFEERKEEWKEHREDGAVPGFRPPRAGISADVRAKLRGCLAMEDDDLRACVQSVVEFSAAIDSA